ncbi:MAG TPA: archaeosortase/exosortase family protein, partial [Telluria sp.]
MQLNDSPLSGRAAAAPLSSASLAMLALAFLAPFLFYFGTAKSLVDVWNSSETFAHGYIILPISLWLIWRRRANFSALPPEPWWPAVGLLLLVGAGWMLARMGEVQVVAQYAFVAMFPVIALA